MNAEHLLPSTRIRAARYAGMAAKDIARRAGLNDIAAHRLACRAAHLTRHCSPEMARDIIAARISAQQEARHV
ncbi:MAG: hypothetical protein MZV65_39630 [Chromatiales bacterium]|nr:hypothetical protein [Chromatiales bacterium]MCK7581148.1 hypothetical protein [Chromatiales bacterium]